MWQASIVVFGVLVTTYIVVSEIEKRHKKEIVRLRGIISRLNSIIDERDDEITKLLDKVGDIPTDNNKESK